MARFCSEIRKAQSISVSMRDIYLNPTIDKLARHLAVAPPEVVVETPSVPLRIPSDFEYWSCGALQLLYYAGYGLLSLWLIATGLDWAYSAAGNTGTLYLRLAFISTALFAVFTAIPIAAKWIAIGRWKEETIPIWSLRYFRFWVVSSLIQANPMMLFVGSPIYNVFLRLLGAKVGANSVVTAQVIPVCTDLLSIGSNTMIKSGAIFQGYRAQSNYIFTGPVHIGDNAFVGEATVIDIHTVMEDGAQLGHASSLHSGQRVPQGKRYHGVPAQETTANYCVIEGRSCTPLRRALYSAVLFVWYFAVLAPLGLLLAHYGYNALIQMTSAARLVDEASGAALLAVGWEMLLISLAIFVSLLVFGLLVIFAVPRLLNLFLQENRTYVLYGVHYWIYLAITNFGATPHSTTCCSETAPSSFII